MALDVGGAARDVLKGIERTLDEDPKGRVTLAWTIDTDVSE